MKATSKIILTLLAISTISLEVTAQVYDPETGTTHYPNGTIYVGSNPDNPDGEYSSVVGYCVEYTRDITCQSHMLFDCNEDPELCEKLLEEAAESAENGNNGGNSGGGNSGGGESEGAENQQFRYLQEQFGLSSKEWSILMKKMEEKPGMYQYRKGDWIFVKSPIEETKKIIAGLRKKGK